VKEGRGNKTLITIILILVVAHGLALALALDGVSASLCGMVVFVLLLPLPALFIMPSAFLRKSIVAGSKLQLKFWDVYLHIERVCESERGGVVSE